MPAWLRRRRRFEGERYYSDREACEAGRDGLESAVNWMQHVLGRDYDGVEVARAGLVVELPDGTIVYTSHSVDARPVEIRGLFEEAVRAQNEIVAANLRHRDIQAFADALVPQLVEALGEKVIKELLGVAKDNGS